jgi:hypothetical protein
MHFHRLRVLDWLLLPMAAGVSDHVWTCEEVAGLLLIARRYRRS